MTLKTSHFRRTPRALAILAMMSFAAPLVTKAQAQPAPLQAHQWSVRLGAGAIIGPAYPGSDSTDVTPVPLIDIAYRPALPLLDTVFLNVPDGLGVIAYDNGTFSVGASIGYAFGRDESEAARLRGMADIDGAARISVFIRADFGQFGLSLQADRSLGDQEGTTLTFGASASQPIGPRFMLLGKIEATWADKEHMQQWFGVTPRQSSRSQFITYAAGSGLRSVGANVMGIYRITDRWSLNASAGVEQLLGDAADSPITERKTQPFGMLGVVYQF